MTQAIDIPSMTGRCCRACCTRAASEVALRGGTADAPYTPSKHGMVGLTKNVAWAYANNGIRCNATVPGPTVTGIVDHVGSIDQKGLARMPPILALQQHCIRAKTAGELADAIQLALANQEGPTLIECVIDRDDCSAELISWGRHVAAANGRPPRPD
ncbi:SDR family oxidoreductase [Mycobacterium sp.]